ncbi:hypothetical protein CP533_0714 [Ophiocordyceps camponoti-saundersi (nom. inval.)]|nr:hypothetical protein CP533_0714 [Ophiocordyceps camponoti-saundersi (nom. inval.)]
MSSKHRHRRSPGVASSGVRLTEIVRGRDERNTNLDIIAIHGLDTTSRVTWTWKDGKGRSVNWLKAPDMLPSVDKEVRIFTCDWPARLLEPAALVQMSVQEHVNLLLEGVQGKLFGDDATRDDERPILFIASCLGGQVLARALVKANEKGSSYHRLRRATRGIVFLATPFRGTSLADVATWAMLGLNIKASLRRQAVSSLLDSCQEPNSDHQELVQRFTSLVQNEDIPLEIFSFYELGKTSLPRKAIPFLPESLSKSKQLVSKDSASLDIIKDPIPLGRKHNLMNKFSGPDCEDYKKVARKIRDMIREIRKGIALVQADRYMRHTSYSEDRLRIVRLSGKVLEMRQCYINLAVIQQSKGQKKPTIPMSLFARLNVETPRKTARVNLATIFDERKRPDGSMMRPRRILIRGSAGVGKTTLCKKMVHEFIHDVESELHRSWKRLYDRLIWIPLSRLKDTLERAREYSLEEVFCDFYFHGLESDHGHHLARQLGRRLNRREGDRTLFILDGLDEIVNDLVSESNKADFVKELLKKPNIIITSRPHFTIPDIRDVDLELETVGFYPGQVREYISQSFKTDPRTAESVQFFLKSHGLVKGLMRIPIQLDALCLAWETLEPGIALDTMTSIYKAITQRLCIKDAEALCKGPDGKPVTTAQLNGPDAERLVCKEMELVENVAFAGLFSEVIEFSPRHQEQIMKESSDKLGSILVNTTFPRLSFLRSSDDSKTQQDVYYHFLHLTFQEFFAARYFVRHWTSREQMTCLGLSGKETKRMDPVQFLQKQKYSARYDVFWRFVSGLLAPDGDGRGRELLDFFNEVQQLPLDILGFTHQRLVMHCLSEVSAEKTIFRQHLENKLGLEKRLKQWHLFECVSGTQDGPFLSDEMEFSTVLRDFLRETSDYDAQVWSLRKLRKWPAVPRPVYEEILLWLGDGKSSESKCTALDVLEDFQEKLTEDIIEVVVRQLDDHDKRVQESALNLLEAQPSLTEGTLTSVRRILDDGNGHLRHLAMRVLLKQKKLSANMLKAAAQRLHYDEDGTVRCEALATLLKYPEYPSDMLSAVTQMLDDQEKIVREVTLYFLQQKPNLSNEMIKVVSRRLYDECSEVQSEAVSVLREQSTLSDKMVAALSQMVHDRETSDSLWANATFALRRRPNIPHNTLVAIARRLGDDSWDVRKAATKTLGHQGMLSDEILAVIKRHLQNEDISIRLEVARFLLETSHGSHEDVLAAARQGLENEYVDQRRKALEAMKQQPSLSDNTMIAIAQLVDDEDVYVRIDALELCGKQRELSNEVTTAIARRLSPTTARTDGAAAAVKDQIDRAIKDIIFSMPKRLDYSNIGLWSEILRLIGKRWNFSDEILAAMTRRPDWENRCYESLFFGFLEKQRNVSDDILRLVGRQVMKTPSDFPSSVETLFRRNKAFYSTLVSGPTVRRTYEILYRRFKQEQLTWYVEGDMSVLNTPEGVMSAKIDDMEELKASISEALEDICWRATESEPDKEDLISSSFSSVVDMLGIHRL